MGIVVELHSILTRVPDRDEQLKIPVPNEELDRWTTEKLGNFV